jgi:hypothetical protein
VCAVLMDNPKSSLFLNLITRVGIKIVSLSIRRSNFGPYLNRNGPRINEKLESPLSAGSFIFCNVGYDHIKVTSYYSGVVCLLLYKRSKALL